SKLVEFSKAAFGIIGLQSNLPLLLELVREDVISLDRMIDSFTAAPARVFGLEYGSLKIGAPADVTVIDPDHEWEYAAENLTSMSKNSPFMGRKMRGVARTVIRAGEIVVHECKLLGS
ncbi:MAG: amidohydrolase family protein, partial [Bdellovibrionales bacterium]|nr:amidohydrolase family protein [Bdellovibrionales bacterium]